MWKVLYGGKYFANEATSIGNPLKEKRGSWRSGCVIKAIESLLYRYGHLRLGINMPMVSFKDIYPKVYEKKIYWNVLHKKYKIKRLL